MPQAPKRYVQWRWLAAAAATAITIVLVFGLQSGSCVDYVSAAAQSDCSSGPAVGWPGAWLIGIVGLLTMAYFVYRAFRRDQPSSRSRQ